MTASCVFCAITAGRAPAQVVKEWDDAIAIVPLGPVTAGHVLVIPRVHVADFADDPEVTGATARRAAQLCRDLHLVHANLITSRGVHATQSVWHLHLHLVPRAATDGLALPWDGVRTTAEEASR
ncbi:HIT family protein [Streptomyces albidoflavus]|uniref:HIT family protein n=1 Tax=Streptomyces albidoflavus TaxID=1886 RepID=UPI0007759144|nr:HIT domain-containing protein [Streptomyces albidoflavus]AMM11232.1 Histidine triad protein [Streptomyces albidoflavus]